jgi:hypothetical protein
MTGMDSTSIYNRAWKTGRSDAESFLARSTTRKTINELARRRVAFGKNARTDMDELGWWDGYMATLADAVARAARIGEAEVTSTEGREARALRVTGRLNKAYTAEGRLTERVAV